MCKNEATWTWHEACPNNEAFKHDANKMRFDLLPAGPLMEIAKVLTYGAKKYSDRNWEKGMEWGRLFAATQRHLWAFWSGEDNDPESQLPHLAHAGFGILALLELGKTHPEFDNRVKNLSPESEMPKWASGMA